MPSQISPGVYDVGGGVTVHLPTLTPSGEGVLTALGWEYDIPGKVEGLTAQGVNLYGAVAAAILAVPLSPPLALGVGLVGQPGATLQAYRIRAVSNGVVEFRLVFRAIGVPQVGGADSVFRIINTAVEIETNKSELTGKIFQATGAASGKLQSKTSNSFRPQPVVEVTRQEGGYPAISSEDYVSTVNSGPCPWDNRTNRQRCWLCIGVEAESRDLKTWSKVYRFQYASPKQFNPVYVGGWDKVVAATDTDGNADITNPTQTIAFEDATKPLVAWRDYLEQDFMIFAFIL